MLKNRKVELSTIIGKNSIIKGDLNISGGIRIDGTVEGTLTTNGFLAIGISGKAKANLNAKECLISGELEGDINVTEELELDKSAKVTGNIIAKTLTVHSGAIISGHCHTGDKKPVLKSNKEEKAEPKKAADWQDKW